MGIEILAVNTGKYSDPLAAWTRPRRRMREIPLHSQGSRPNSPARDSPTVETADFLGS